MTVRLTVRSKNRKKAKKWHFDPKMAIWVLSSSIQNVAWVLFVWTNWCNNERKRKGKWLAKSLCLDQDSNPGLNFSQQKSTVGYTVITVGCTVITVDNPLNRLKWRSTPSFLWHRYFDALTARTIHRTVTTVQNRSDGGIAQPWIFTAQWLPNPDCNAITAITILRSKVRVTGWDVATLEWLEGGVHFF